MKNVCVFDLVNKKKVCITAGDYEAAMTAMEMMSHMGLQPEPEQEKRMLQSCVDPLWVAKRERLRARQEEEEEGRDKDGDGNDVWRERETADRIAEEDGLG